MHRLEIKSYFLLKNWGEKCWCLAVLKYSGVLKWYWHFKCKHFCWDTSQASELTALGGNKTEMCRLVLKCVSQTCVESCVSLACPEMCPLDMFWNASLAGVEMFQSGLCCQICGELWLSTMYCMCHFCLYVEMCFLACVELCQSVMLWHYDIMLIFFVCNVFKCVNMSCAEMSWSD